MFSVSVCWSISCIVLNSRSVVCNGPFCFLCKPSIVMSLFVSLFLMLFILFLMSVSVWCSVSLLYSTWLMQSQGLVSVLSLVRCMYRLCP